MYTLIFAVPGIDSCQFGGYLGLSQGHSVVMYQWALSSGILPKLHKQSPREQPEVDSSCSLLAFSLSSERGAGSGNSSKILNMTRGLLEGRKAEIAASM